MINRILVLSALVALTALAGCGTELGRVAFAAEGASEATVTLAAGEVHFWTDIDIDYKGDAALGYRVELVQNGAVVANVDCNPLGPMSVKMSWVETNFGSSHSRSGSGKMDCSVALAHGGPTVVRARLVFVQKPATLTLKKADLAVKQ